MWRSSLPVARMMAAAAARGGGRATATGPAPRRAAAELPHSAPRPAARCCFSAPPQRAFARLMSSGRVGEGVGAVPRASVRAGAAAAPSSPGEGRAGEGTAPPGYSATEAAAAAAEGGEDVEGDGEELPSMRLPGSDESFDDGSAFLGQVGGRRD